MKKFPILKIPDVVFREVTSMMTPTEIIKLSMSNFIMELMLRNRKCKINAIIVQTGNIYSQIDTKSARDCLSVFFKKSENDQRNPVTQLVQLQDKYQEETDGNLYLTHVSLDEMFRIYSNLTRLFSCPFHKWVIIFDEMKLEEFWQYTERILKLKFQRFAVHAKTMSNVVLTELMDKIPEKMEVIIDSDIPLDYSHPKALRFRSFKYTEARWLKIEDVFNFRNLCLIKLDRTHFDCSDVIKFLNYWSDFDEDMMEGIAMGLKEGTQIDEEEIIKNFIVISDNESSHSRFFMKARNMGNRKLALGELAFRENKVTFSASDPSKEDCLYEYSILELVHQKRDCEEKIRNMEKEFRGLRDAEKRKLQLELEIIENKLTDLNRDYEIRNFET
ncbi:unnamed protein product [Caenorhabditis nigoni]